MRLTKPIYAGNTADLNNEPCEGTAISESKRNRKRQAVWYQRFVRLYWRRKATSDTRSRESEATLLYGFNLQNLSG